MGDWWDSVGAYAQFFPDAPALAVDMATKGPQHSDLGFALADKVQRTPTQLQVYPSQAPGGD